MEIESMIKLPDSELEIMQAIWSLDQQGNKHITAASIMENFSEISRLKLTTVLTLITRLQAKGFISVDKIGRANCCTPLISRTNYLDFITKDFIYRVFLGNKEDLVNLLNK